MCKGNRMKRERGFYETRRRRQYFTPSYVYWWLAALAALTLLAGAARVWPQSSGSSSNSSSEDLKTWDELSERFVTGLNEQSEQLLQALTEMQASKASSQSLTRLLERSLQANSSLRNYNVQMTYLIRELREELARKDAEISRLEKLALRLVIALVSACAALAVMIILTIQRRR